MRGDSVRQTNSTCRVANTVAQERANVPRVALGQLIRTELLAVRRIHGSEQ